MMSQPSNVCEKCHASCFPLRLRKLVRHLKNARAHTPNISSLCLPRRPQNFDLSMNVSICVTSKTSDRKSSQGYTFVEAVFGMWLRSQMIPFSHRQSLFVIRSFFFCFDGFRMLCVFRIQYVKLYTHRGQVESS